MAQAGIQNLIFDLGGVIINLDTSRTWSALKRLTGAQWPKIEKAAREQQILHHYETGLISTTAFREFFNVHLAEPIPEATFDVAFNAMLLDVPAKRLEFLRETAKNYRIFLLSNTNPLHIDQIYADLKRFHQIDNFDGIFERVYLSYEMGLRKPDPAIYQQVIDNHQLDPSATLFIDDVEENLDGAAKAGISGLHLTANMELSDLKL